MEEENMADKFVSEKNINFLLYDVFDMVSLTEYEYYSEHNKKMFDMVLKACLKLSKNMLWPVFAEMDREPPELKEGAVVVHPSVAKILKEFGRGGWITSTVPFDQDGEQLPHMIADMCQYIFAAANYSASAYPGLCAGAAHLIQSFGSQELYDRYVAKMRSGKWQGTMALTEPEAGSSLSDITTTAEPTGDGYYSIKGQKIFISAGDHNYTENVIHLMLAKIKGAPPGVKGISLFVVPKKRIAEDGSLEANDVVTSGVYHKLGYRGCPIVQLSIGDRGDCRGWLVGEEHNGLRYMFQMMNEARIGVGLGATSMATAAYYSALDYCRTRKQGRRISGKDPLKPQVAIIEHADVKRMLLFQRAVTEGALSLLMQCSKLVDLQKVSEGEQKEKYSLLLDLLTPIAKSYPSEMGILAISQGLQCFGGSGFCDDYPLEQYYRDARIHPIHEGTTAMHGMDLLGRKVTMKGGAAFDLFLEEVNRAIKTAEQFRELRPYAGQLGAALEQLQDITKRLQEILAEKGIEYYMADATLYLELFGIVAIAWQWLLQGITVQKQCSGDEKKAASGFFQGKMYTLKYFYTYELPKMAGLISRLELADGLTLEVTSDQFDD
jgi:alkylation response protein AidB-like acyl-CoA dehydrogenase